MNQLREASTVWLKDGEFDAYIIRINPTDSANTDYQLSNPLGRIPVGMQIIKKNMAVDCFVKSASVNTVIVQFTLKDADVTLRMW